LALVLASKPAKEYSCPKEAGAEDQRMDVVAWLHGLGLEQYAPAFRDNDIDGEVLPELTPDDLISIGVTSVGHRRSCWPP
jgi:SAM (Sterile alpha motif) domain-containing protein